MRSKKILYLDEIIPYTSNGDYILEENLDDVFQYDDFIKTIDTQKMHPLIENKDNSCEAATKANDREPYKPALTRKLGLGKEGYCRECDKWFRLKTSSYWYHMNFIHGINSDGKKYPEPKIKIGIDRLESFCKVCKKWIFLGIKRGTKSYRFTWFKHWQKNHKKF